jgi:hypothetical protein
MSPASPAHPDSSWMARLARNGRASLGVRDRRRNWNHYRGGSEIIKDLKIVSPVADLGELHDPAATGRNAELLLSRSSSLESVLNGS